MRTWLQHSLNPLNLWSRLGGKFTFAFRLYETYCWEPILRRLLGQNGNNGTHFSGNRGRLNRGDSPSPPKTASQLAKPVIPDELACGERDPESIENSI